MARRLRVAGTHILPESSPADINVRYSSVRLAPGMSATVDILLHAEQPGKIVAQVEVRVAYTIGHTYAHTHEHACARSFWTAARSSPPGVACIHRVRRTQMSSEDDFFVIPVTATFLSPDGFQAAMEKSHNPKRKANKSHQYLSSGPADEAIEKLLIPGATHKFVMVVVPPSSNNATAGAAPSSPGAGEGLSIVEQMEAKLRAAGYTPKPIRSDRRLRRHHRADSAGGAGTASGDASAGEDDGGYGDEDADDDAGQVCGCVALRSHAWPLALTPLTLTLVLTLLRAGFGWPGLFVIGRRQEGGSGGYDKGRQEQQEGEGAAGCGRPTHRARSTRAPGTQQGQAHPGEAVQVEAQVALHCWRCCGVARTVPPSGYRGPMSQRQS